MASREAMRTVRRVFVILFFAWCAAIVVLGIVAVIGVFLANPFADFAGRKEFTDLSGSSAKHSLAGAWPPDVDIRSVEAVSYKTEWSRDSHSTWYRIRLTKDAAARWADRLHPENGRISKASLHGDIEGVYRMIDGPPPLHRQTGDTPVWWTPPPIKIRATEGMLWYKDYYSGVGSATYSGFDESTTTLWIYEYACQHDILWSHGRLPSGEPIGAAEK
jgi:hypothetical protein